MWELNPRGLSTTDLAGLPHTRLGESRTPKFKPCMPDFALLDVQFEHLSGQLQHNMGTSLIKVFPAEPRSFEDKKGLVETKVEKRKGGCK